MADSLRPVIASVVGLTSETRWGQVLSTPHAYGVVEINAPDGIARTRGIQILTKLTRIFDVPPVSLDALSDIADTMTDDDVVSLILLVPVGVTLYLVCRGSGAVYIKRGETFARLLDKAGDLSGDIRIGDSIIAASARFTESLSAGEMVGMFDHLSPSEVAEKMTIRLHEREGGEGGAALIVQMGSVPEEDTQTKDEPALSPSRMNSGLAIMLSRSKAFIRHFTTAHTRARIRSVARHAQTSQHFTPRRLIAYVVLCTFVVSVLLGVRRQYVTRQTSAATEVVAGARHAFEEGMALLELNPVKGRERLTTARDALLPLVSKKNRLAQNTEAKMLYEDVVKNLTQAMHIVEVKPDLYYDMGLVKKDAIATDVSLFENTIGVLDARGKTAYTLGIPVKSGVIVGGGQSLEGGTHIASYGDKAYIWTPSGIHEIRLTDQKTTQSIIPASNEWGTISDMAAFGGNVYLLDTVKSRIWKYVVAEKGFSQLFEYLNPDTLPDLSRATNMAIDGSVWLGSTNGVIMRYTAGKENSFTPQGLDTPLGQRLTVYASDTAMMVYVLDSDHQRVAVFDKDGLYISQYVWKTGFAPTSIAVSESTHKLFLLAEGKIYSVDLK